LVFGVAPIAQIFYRASPGTAGLFGWVRR